jgi:hypothetical protein
VSTDLSLTEYTLLDELRRMTVIRREPTATAPDGHRTWFTFDELHREGKVSVDRPNENWARAARHLERSGLIKHHRRMGVTRYQVTPLGIGHLTAHERAEGTSALVAAEIDADQARYDRDRAEARYQAACTRADQAHGIWLDAQRARVR